MRGRAYVYVRACAYVRARRASVRTFACVHKFAPLRVRRVRAYVHAWPSGVGHLGHDEAMEAGGREFDP